MIQAQHAPKENGTTLSDFLKSYGLYLSGFLFFVIMGFTVKSTQDLQALQIKEDRELIVELQKARNQDRELLIEMRSDIKYLIKQTKNETK